MALLGRVDMVISRTSHIPNKDQCPTQLSNNRFSSSYNNSDRLLNPLIKPIRRNPFKRRPLSRNPFKLRQFSNNLFKLSLFNNLLRFNMFSNLLKPSPLNNLFKLSHFNSHLLNLSPFSRTSFLNLSMSSRSSSCLSKHNMKRSTRKPSPRLRLRHPLFLIPSLLSLMSSPRLNLISSSSNLRGLRIYTIPMPPTLIRTFKLGHSIMLEMERIWPVLCILFRFLD